MKNYLWIRAGFAFAFFSYSFSAWSSARHVLPSVDLAQQLVPYNYGEAPAPLERSMLELSDVIQTWCKQNNSDLNIETACLWPLAVAEFRAMGAKLAPAAGKNPNLILNLATGLHPMTFLRSATEGGDFDATYGRFLIARRLMREIWPSLLVMNSRIGLGLTPLHDWIVPWSGARSPLSFFLNLSRNYRCLGGVSECSRKQEIIAVLKKVVAEIEEDDDLIQALAAYREGTVDPNQDDKITGLYKGLLNVVADESNGGLMMFTAGFTGTFDTPSAAAYLADVAAESQKPVDRFIDLSGDACADISAVLAAAAGDPATSEWASQVKSPLDCQASDGRLTSIGGAGLEELKARRAFWKFNFYHLRLLVKTLFAAMPGLDENLMQQRVLHEQLADIENVRLQLAKIEDPSQSMHFFGTIEEFKPAMLFLYRYVLSVYDSAEELRESKASE